jgi:hypothetical protein
MLRLKQPTTRAMERIVASESNAHVRKMLNIEPYSSAAASVSKIPLLADLDTKPLPR